MPIAIACPHCDWKGRVKDELAGKKGKCPTCGELIPIPSNPAPSAMSGGKRSTVDDEPDVVDDRPSVRSKSSNSEGRRRSFDEDDGPRRRRPVDDFDDDDRPSRSRRRPTDDDDSDERPARRRPRDDSDSDDDRPRRARRLDSEDEDKPRPRRRTFDVDGDDEPRRRRKRPVRRESSGGPNMKMVIGGIVLLVIMIVWFVVGLVFFDLCFYWPPIGSILAIITIIRGMMGANE